MDIDELLRKNSGIRLDIGCGENKHPGFIGMDIQPLDGVDIVHNWNDMPWPLPDESVVLAIASHVVEHVSPIDGHFMRWMDEVWRIMVPGGEFAIACPHGSSQGYIQDPTHCNQLNETSWLYFCPGLADGALWRFYKSKPWHIKPHTLVWDPTANMEVVLIKMEESDG